MKTKRLSLVIVALLAAGGGLWLARSDRRTHAFHKSSMGVSVKMPRDRHKPGEMLRPPNPNRKFQDLTPEQRVKLARQGPIGG